MTAHYDPARITEFLFDYFAEPDSEWQAVLDGKVPDPRRTAKIVAASAQFVLTDGSLDGLAKLLPKFLKLAVDLSIQAAKLHAIHHETKHTHRFAGDVVVDLGFSNSKAGNAARRGWREGIADQAREEVARILSEYVASVGRPPRFDRDDAVALLLFDALVESGLTQHAAAKRLLNSGHTRNSRDPKAVVNRMKDLRRRAVERSLNSEQLHMIAGLTTAEIDTLCGHAPR